MQGREANRRRHRANKPTPWPRAKPPPLPQQTALLAALLVRTQRLRSCVSLRIPSSAGLASAASEAHPDHSALHCPGPASAPSCPQCPPERIVRGAAGRHCPCSPATRPVERSGHRGWGVARAHGSGPRGRARCDAAVGRGVGRGSRLSGTRGRLMPRSMRNDAEIRMPRARLHLRSPKPFVQIHENCFTRLRQQEVPVVASNAPAKHREERVKVPTAQQPLPESVCPVPATLKPIGPVVSKRTAVVRLGGRRAGASSHTLDLADSSSSETNFAPDGQME